MRKLLRFWGKVSCLFVLFCFFRNDCNNKIQKYVWVAHRECILKKMKNGNNKKQSHFQCVESVDNRKRNNSDYRIKEKFYHGHDINGSDLWNMIIRVSVFLLDMTLFLVSFQLQTHWLNVLWVGYWKSMMWWVFFFPSVFLY